jgi:hypothetical protein
VPDADSIQSIETMNKILGPHLVIKKEADIIYPLSLVRLDKLYPAFAHPSSRLVIWVEQRIAVT